MIDKPLCRARTFVAATVFALLTASVPAAATVNKAIRIDDGESVSRNLDSVNGSITVGRDAQVAGHAETVNGSITIRDGASVRGAETVNGAVRIGAKAMIKGDVETVNGGISTEIGTEIDGNVETVNGGAKLAGTIVTGHLRTHNGSVRLQAATQLRGDLIVEKVRSGWFSKKSRLKIYVEDGSVVKGDIVVKDNDRDVQVIVSGGGRVEGKIQGAELIRR